MRPLPSDLRYLSSYRRILACRLDYKDRYPEAFRDLSKWISEARIVRKFHIVEGLEKAPEALPLLYTGGNTGKLSVPTSSRSCLRVPTIWNFSESSTSTCPEPTQSSENMDRRLCFEATVIYRRLVELVLFFVIVGRMKPYRPLRFCKEAQVVARARNLIQHHDAILMQWFGRCGTETEPEPELRERVSP